MTSEVEAYLLGMIQAQTTPSKAASCCLWYVWTLTFFLLGCAAPEDHTTPSLYEATFATAPPTKVLVERSSDIWVVRNGDERIQMRRVGEGMYVVPVFRGSWLGQWEEERWVGVWIDSLRPGDYRVPLSISPLIEGSSVANEPELNQTWETSEGLLLTQIKGDSIWATISTPTGDYRYLAGKKHHNLLTINTFDGSHLFRFEAELKGDSLVNGTFLSGTHYRTSFSGVLVEQPAISWNSARQNTNGSVLDVRGVSSGGDTIQWSNDRLRELGKKGMVLDVMGTWCPNCMDEGRLLTELAPGYPDVQFVSLAFERSTDASILPRLDQFKDELALGWDVLLGGKASKRIAAEVLGLVDTVHSFPTTVFWATDGEPVVHTGFNGPATGKGYVEERAFFEDQLDRLSGRSKNR